MLVHFLQGYKGVKDKVMQPITLVWIIMQLKGMP